MKFHNPNLKIDGDYMISNYCSTSTEAVLENGVMKLHPVTTKYEFKTKLTPPKLGVLLVGIGGNNGTTVIGGILANKHKISWKTKEGVQHPNFYGSITQATTTKVGVCGAEEIFMPLKDLMPLVDPESIVMHGWDISKSNLAEAMERAQVVNWDLQCKLRPYMENIIPMKAVVYKEFIAKNQEDRCDNVIEEGTKWDHVEILRKDIRKFKTENHLDKVVVLWTANTERRTIEEKGVHDNAENLLAAIKANHSEVSASTIYAVASILEGTSFINGSAQNTLITGVIDLAEKNGVYICGDDFKSGQTKLKTCLADFFISAGIKPKSIVSYNHLGNNDGKNLSQESTFKSKEHSKKGCVDDMLASNSILYTKKELEEGIDHVVVIKYVPSAGDSKKAIDEYQSSIFLNGVNTISIYNVCEDSLLAAPLIIDLILMTEILQRISYKKGDSAEFKHFHPVLTFLGYLCKAPLTIKDAPLVNSLPRQKAAIENLFKVCCGIPIEDNLLLEYRTFQQEELKNLNKIIKILYMK